MMSSKQFPWMLAKFRKQQMQKVEKFWQIWRIYIKSLTRGIK